MKGLDGFYGSCSGTNRYMTQSIVDHLTGEALNGSDLSDEERVIGRVHRSCWGGCGEESEDGSGEEYRKSIVQYLLDLSPLHTVMRYIFIGLPFTRRYWTAQNVYHVTE